MTSTLDPLLFWRHKTATDNEWHPLPGAKKSIDGLPPWLSRIDVAATAVDAAPIVAGIGALAYIRQLPHIGMTVPASLFKNRTTLLALTRTSNLAFLSISVAQAAGLEYRYLIPRWAHGKERRRDENEARQHVEAGMAAGAVILLLRNLFRLGPAFTRRTILDVVLVGAVADVCLREYYRAHSLH